MFTGKTKKAIVAISCLIAVSTLIIIVFTMRKNETKNADGSVIIKRSVVQGDEQYDARLPEDACAGLLAEVQKKYPGKKCRLIESKRLDSDRDGNITEECVDGAGIGGCFACQFECK